MPSIQVSFDTEVDSGGASLVAFCKIPGADASKSFFQVLNNDVPAQLKSPGVLCCQVSLNLKDVMSSVPISLFVNSECVASCVYECQLKAPSAKKVTPLEGRFSGRLARKEDEIRLVEECLLLAPLLLGEKGVTGGVQEDVRRGSADTKMSLSKLVRCLASGEVRAFCTAREERIKELEEQVRGLSQQLRQVNASGDHRNSVPLCSEPTTPDVEPVPLQQLNMMLSRKKVEVEKLQGLIRKRLDMSFNSVPFFEAAVPRGREDGLVAARSSAPGSKRSASQLELDEMMYGLGIIEPSSARPSRNSGHLLNLSGQHQMAGENSVDTEHGSSSGWACRNSSTDNGWAAMSGAPEASGNSSSACFGRSSQAPPGQQGKMELVLETSQDEGFLHYTSSSDAKRRSHGLPSRQRSKSDFGCLIIGGAEYSNEDFAPMENGKPTQMAFPSNLVQVETNNTGTLEDARFRARPSRPAFHLSTHLPPALLYHAPAPLMGDQENFPFPQFLARAPCTGSYTCATVKEEPACHLHIQSEPIIFPSSTESSNGAAGRAGEPNVGNEFDTFLMDMFDSNI